jgi:ketosteroid isomerase-like protein
MSKRESTRDLVRRAYAAFNARDLDSALAALHPNVDWPNTIDGGRVRGHDEIRRYWMGQFEFLDPRVEPQDFFEDEHGRLVVEVRQVVRDLEGTLIADERVEHVYAFRDGLIARMDIREPSASNGNADKQQLEE